jgi:hypothetical protein
VFAIHGFIYASWAVRVPAVKQQAQASESGLRAGLTTLSFLALAAAAIAYASREASPGESRA